MRAVRDRVRAQANEAYRIIGNQLLIERANVYRLEYSLDGKAFTAWFSGDDGPVHAPISPFTDAVLQLVESSLDNWKEGRQGEAALDLKKALQMAKSSKACAKVLDPLMTRIPDKLLRRASSFSLRFWYLSHRFWFKGQKPVAKIITAVVGFGFLGILLLCCGTGLVFVQVKSATKQEVVEADNLWNAGDKAAAVEKYKCVLAVKSKIASLGKKDAAPVYGRVIDLDVERGDKKSAKELIDLAIKRNVAPLVYHPDAIEMVLSAQRR